MRCLDVTRWSRKTEFIVVLGTAFGWFSFASLWSLFAPPSGAELAANDGWLGLLIFELMLLAPLIWLLHRRGWTAARVGLTPSWPDTAIGVGLMILAYGVYVILFAAVWTIVDASAPVGEWESPATAPIDLTTILAVSAVNGLFEELFVCGYLITVVKDARGFWPAINASTALRLLYHMYQGTAAIVSILPLGLIFGYWYARTGRLWPLVVAHVIFDVLALLAIGT
jgi:membrane protease YdiL (CAAX protease family)